MKILGIDTSTEMASLAVLDNGLLLAELHTRVLAKHGETLLPHIECLLQLARSRIEEFELFGVGIGPGSFTGTRIGVATIKGLALGTAIAVVGVDSLRALAATVMGLSETVIPVIDAHKGEVFLGVYAESQGQLRTLREPFNGAPAAAFAKACQGVDVSRTLFCGNGAATYFQELSLVIGAEPKMAPAYTHVPRGAAVAYEAFQQWSRLGASDVATLEPLYVRASDAILPRS